MVEAALQAPGRQMDVGGWGAESESESSEAVLPSVPVLESSVPVSDSSISRPRTEPGACRREEGYRKEGRGGGDRGCVGEARGEGEGGAGVHQGT